MYLATESIVREAVKEDYFSVEALMKQVHNIHVTLRPDIYRESDRVLSQEEFEKYCDSSMDLVAENQGETIGVVFLLTRNISGSTLVTRKILFIDAMVVDEKYRNQGVGSKLFETILEIVKSQQYDGLELQVNAANVGAKAMYEKFGFTEKSVNMEFLR
jgi:ribosomal protein S18 acetylase RimI-like enzyme